MVARLFYRARSARFPARLAGLCATLQMARKSPVWRACCAVCWVVISLLRGLPAWRAKRRFFVGYVVSLIQMAVRRRVDDGSHAPRLKRCRLYPLLRCWMCRSILPGWKRRLQEISDDSTDPLHSMMPLAHACLLRFESSTRMAPPQNSGGLPVCKLDQKNARPLRKNAVRRTVFLAQQLTRLHCAQCRGRCWLDIRDLNDVIAKFRLDQIADFILLQLKGRFLKGFDHHASAKITQVAALLCRTWVLGMRARHFRKAFRLSAHLGQHGARLCQRLIARLGCGFGRQRNQDMAGANLIAAAVVDNFVLIRFFKRRFRRRKRCGERFRAA